jgi:hypothetical protein
MKLRKLHIVITLLVLGTAALILSGAYRRPAIAVLQLIRGKASIADRVAEHGDVVRERLLPNFESAGVAYPPGCVILAGFKHEKRLDVWAAARGGGELRFIRCYPVLGASGTLGPKLREGDRQVPEGLYEIESLNPNSIFHLSLRLNYPNEFDSAMGERDGRDDLGCDIMIHGNDCSIGCLAMGDAAAEDLFVLAAETGIELVTVIISPVDFRERGLPDDTPDLPPWTGELYAEIKAALEDLR